VAIEACARCGEPGSRSIEEVKAYTKAYEDDGDVYLVRLVRDHNHVTGQVRGWICTGCNVRVGHYEHPYVYPDQAAKTEAYLAARDDHWRSRLGSQARWHD
jgi:hypothetical protein